MLIALGIPRPPEGARGAHGRPHGRPHGLLRHPSGVPVETRVRTRLEVPRICNGVCK